MELLEARPHPAKWLRTRRAPKGGFYISATLCPASTPDAHHTPSLAPFKLHLLSNEFKLGHMPWCHTLGKGHLQGPPHNVHIYGGDVEHPPKHILQPFSACVHNIVIAPQLVKMINPTHFLVVNITSSGTDIQLKSEVYIHLGWSH